MVDSIIDNETNEKVRDRYAQAAKSVSSGGSCCASDGSQDVVTSHIYDVAETAGLPEEAVLASLGCGNPTALATLAEGETVLDLGSGGGIDVLLSAQRVGPTGFVYGLDMTDEMLALALKNKSKAGVNNVAFLKGQIEDIPLPADSVDVIISNCVVNLSSDKGRVLREAFRVLRPSGRLAISDVVADGPLPESLRVNMEAWVGCISGALDIDAYRELLLAAGFENVEVDIVRRYTVAEAGLDTAALPAGWEKADGRIGSASIRAAKPRAAVPAQVTPASSSTPTPECCGSRGCCT